MFHLARADGRHGRMLFHLTKCHKRSCMVYQLATLTTRLVMCNQHFVIKVSCDTTVYWPTDSAPLERSVEALVVPNAVYSNIFVTLVHSRCTEHLQHKPPRFAGG